MSATIEKELTVSSRDDWRAWLDANCESAQEVWLVINKAANTKPGVRYTEAVEDALCFGWIDSQTRRRDEMTTYQRFSPRRAKSPWSRSNRERVERLVAAGLMTPRGYAEIDAAKRDGRWPE